MLMVWDRLTLGGGGVLVINKIMFSLQEERLKIGMFKFYKKGVGAQIPCHSMGQGVAFGFHKTRAPHAMVWNMYHVTKILRQIMFV